MNGVIDLTIARAVAWLLLVSLAAVCGGIGIMSFLMDNHRGAALVAIAMGCIALAWLVI
jgi:hypothetical protein